MNYSTLKKTVALSVVALMAVGVANAHTLSDTTKMSSGMSTPKVFGGLGQYNIFSFGINAGVTTSQVQTGGINDFRRHPLDFGYGANIRVQLSHIFSIQGNYTGGKVKGNNGKDASGNFLGSRLGGTAGYTNFVTHFNQWTINGVANIGSINFLHRSSAINFYGTAGAGYAYYGPQLFSLDGPPRYFYTEKGNKSIVEYVIPIGVGVKYKITDALGASLSYTENFIDGDNFDGIHAKPNSADKYSYAAFGLEYTFGPKSKPNIEWVNPVALMYDELYDAALRAEVEALKGRVTNVETAVADLKKDSDGDGVADQFDKCPNTPAGSVVDGSGCVIVFPKDTTKAAMGGAGAGVAAAYANIQFEFDSSVLRTSSYPVLDATSADLRSSGKTMTVAGYASSEGTDAHNMRLSKDRANSVKTYLVNSGVEAKHLKIKAYGETHPIADNSTEEGRVANRRVEFH